VEKIKPWLIFYVVLFGRRMQEKVTFCKERAGRVEKLVERLWKSKVKRALYGSFGGF